MLSLADRDRRSRTGRSAGSQGTLVAVLVLVAAVLVGWLVLRDGEPATGPAETQEQLPARQLARPPSEAGTTTDTTAAPASEEVLLRSGDSGQAVTEWQELLQSADLDVDADGLFGPATEEATRSFQRAVGQEPTGQVTDRTMVAAEHAAQLRLVEVSLLREGALTSVERRVDAADLAGGAVRSLVQAPLAAEQEEGLSSAIPAGTIVDGVSVQAGTATVALRGFAADPDAQSMQQRVDQVVDTLSQFPSVDQVQFSLPADDLGAFADAGVTLAEPLPGGSG